MHHVRRILIVIIVYAVSISATLYALDAWLRTFYVRQYPSPPWQMDSFYKPDGDLVYRYAPDTHKIWEEPEFVQDTYINPVGVRGPTDMTETKLPGTYRILMAGDSFTFGHGLNDDQTISAHMTGLLNAVSPPGMRVEVLNTGVQGYSPDQSYRLLLSNIPRFRPDLVIWSLIPGNMEDCITEGPAYRAQLYGVSPQHTLVPYPATTNALYLRNQLFRYAPAWVRNSYVFDAYASLLTKLHPLSRIPDAPPERQRAWIKDKVLLEMSAVHDLCRRNGCALVSAWIPTLASLRRQMDGREETDIRFSAADLSDRGIRYLNTADALAALFADRTASGSSMTGEEGDTAADPQSLYFVYDYHPNATGAAVIARIFSSYVRDTYLPHATGSAAAAAGN